ncbi:MAG: CPBP family intramembrane metalloprotease [Anaerolineae bacterium]|nr:CPBP family intramembrane metalloprotease [Anaerolineae bacterium]
MNMVAAWLMLFLYLAFAWESWCDWLRRAQARLGDWMVFLLLLPYLLAVGFQPSVAGLVQMVVFLALPVILLRLRRPDARPFDLWHILVVLCLWVSIEPSLFILFADLIAPGAGFGARLAGVRLLPQVDALLLPGVGLPVDMLTAILLMLYLFLIYRPLKEIGFSFRWRWRDLRIALLGLGLFMAAGIPTGLAIGFLRFRPALPNFTDVVIGIISGYLLVALPEEVLFRGAIQNMLRQRLKSNWIALLIAAPIFGLAHLNNATRGFAAPNWGYVLMASLAGLAYGYVWMHTRKVTAAAITHMLVNLLWGILFPS